MLHIQTILHPTDLSEQSRHALHAACAMARDYQARLVIVYVALPPIMLYGAELAAGYPETFSEKAQAQLQRLELPIEVHDVERRVVEGDPADAILDVAKDIAANVIVMGTRARSLLGRIFAGSVADKVVRRAKCPVLTVSQPIADIAPRDQDHYARAG